MQRNIISNLAVTYSMKKRIQEAGGEDEDIIHMKKNVSLF